MFASEFRNEKSKTQNKINHLLKLKVMKTLKRNLTLSITVALISVLSISIGATALRNTKNSHTRFYVRPAEKAKPVQTSVINYKGEWIPMIQLKEVIISDTATQKKK
jgi:hypothetical protein